MGGAPSIPPPAAPAAAPPPPPTSVNPAVIAARQNMIDRQAQVGRGSTVFSQTGNKGETLGQAVVLGMS